MSRTIKTQALVITCKDMGESDRLITFFTHGYGKLRGIAKGAKRSKKRFVNALEPFTCLQLSYVSSRTGSLGRIESVEIMENYPKISNKIDSYCMASLCCELVDKWMKEFDPNIRLYELFLWLLRFLSHELDPKRATLFFKTKMLGLVGYAPDCVRCCLCKNNLRQIGSQTRLYDSGFICASCQNAKKSGFTISPGALMTLKYIQEKPLEDLHRLIVSDTIFQESWSILQHLHCYHLQSIPISYEVMSNINILTKNTNMTN